MEGSSNQIAPRDKKNVYKTDENRAHKEIRRVRTERERNVRQTSDTAFFSLYSEYLVKSQKPEIRTL